MCIRDRLGEALARLLVDDKQLARLRELAQKVRDSEVGLQAVATQLVIEHCQGGLQVDGQPAGEADAQQPLILTERTLVELPGQLRLGVTPGRTGAVEQRQQLLTESVQAAYAKKGERVVAAFYGHPGVFVAPSHLAIAGARKEGFEARMLPGISAEDCLFADVGFDPGERGCQSFEATDFLLRKRVFDVTSPLVLWQVGVIGVRDYQKSDLWGPRGLEVLVRRLLEFYPLPNASSPFGNYLSNETIRGSNDNFLAKIDLNPTASDTFSFRYLINDSDSFTPVQSTSGTASGAAPVPGDGPVSYTHLTGPTRDAA